MKCFEMVHMANGGLALVLEPFCTWGEFPALSEKWISQLNARTLSKPIITSNECLVEVEISSGEFWITYDDFQNSIQLEPRKSEFNEIVSKLRTALMMSPESPMQNQKVSGFDCPNCGKSAGGAFVQFGSYFTRCWVCKWEGPATTWLALANQLTNQETPSRAVIVDDQLNEVEVVGEGSFGELIESISNAASQGKLVRLFIKRSSSDR